MSYIALEKILKQQDGSVFKLVLASASRANELAQGSPPVIKTNSKKVSTVALEEIVAGKVTFEGNSEKAKKSEE